MAEVDHRKSFGIRILPQPSPVKLAALRERFRSGMCFQVGRDMATVEYVDADGQVVMKGGKRYSPDILGEPVAKKK